MHPKTTRPAKFKPTQTGKGVLPLPGLGGGGRGGGLSNSCRRPLMIPNDANGRAEMATKSLQSLSLGSAMLEVLLFGTSGCGGCLDRGLGSRLGQFVSSDNIPEP